MPNISETPLAIVGMDCQLPGAENLDEFWQLLVEGRSELGELPIERFDPALHFHPDKGVRTKSYAKVGGIVADAPFDAATYPLPDELIENSHKVHLTLFKVAARACRNAGLDPYRMPEKRKVGVYIGHTPPSSISGNLLYARQIAETAQYLRDVEGFDQLTGGEQDTVIKEIIEEVRSQFRPGDKVFSLSANAYHASSLITTGFHLDGPSMSFDAACASSLRALGHGARALQLGQIDMAIIGGASFCHSDLLVMFSQAQSLTTSISRPFDTNADGLVASEGYAVVVLKTLEQALADDDDVLAVIRGIGISSDGKGKSLWAPREEGQIEAIHRAYPQDISVDDLQFIEMHATSTQVGDATELAALTQVLNSRLTAGKKIPVGSVKANVGHTLEAAGLASLCKTVLAMKHGIIPRQINIDQLNEKIDWTNSPFYVPQESMAWPEPAPGKPRRAAVNAFGIGGLNVHVVLDQFCSQSSPKLIAAPLHRDQKATAEKTRPEDEPIAVIGMGAVFAGAHTIDAMLDRLREGTDPKHALPQASWTQYVDENSADERQWRVPTPYGGFIEDYEYDWKQHRVPPKQVATADPLQFMLLDAADQAIRDSGYHEKDFDRLRAGVIVGTIFGGVFTDKLQMGLRLTDFEQTLKHVLQRRGVAAENIDAVYQKYADILLKHMPALIDETGSFTCSTLASRITKTFNLMGGAVAVDAGDTSATAAISASIDLLRAGDCDMMLCAAGQTLLGCATYTSLRDKGMFSGGETGAPFDAQANGCVPGEGVGVVMLKRLSDAQRDGDRIHAVIHGIGVACNDDLTEGLGTAIQRGLEASRIEPGQVSVIEAGSTGHAVDDNAEIKATAHAYGNGERRDESLVVGSAASQFGYTGGVSAMASLFKTISDLNNTSIPKNVGLEQPSDVAIEHSGTLRLATERTGVPAVNEDGRLIAGINSYSQYNTAYHMLVEGMAKVPKKVAHPAKIPEAAAPHSHVVDPAGYSAWRTVRIGAADMTQLSEQLAQASPNAGSLFEAERQSAFQHSDRARIAFVCQDVAELTKQLALASKQLGKPKFRPLLAEQGVFWDELGLDRPHVAFLFPGQGSQYDGMLKTLVENYPPAARAMQEVDVVLKKLGLPSFANLAWENGEELGNDVWRTQLSLIAANAIVYAAVTAMGLKPDRVSGHSFGELAAMLAAKCWSFEEAVRATSARCAAIDSCTNTNGQLLSTDAPFSELEALCAKVGGDAFVSHRNAPAQTVAGGTVHAIEKLKVALEQAGFKALILNVPAAFHTPLMESVKDPFRRGLEGIVIEPPRVPLLSSVTNRYVADPEDLRENLVVQMTQPLNYTGLAERLADEGRTVFVEVGPRQVLTGLHKRTFEDGSVTIVSCDHSKRDGLQQLLFARACVEVSGALDPPTDHATLRLTEESASDSPETASQDDYAGLNLLRLSGTPYEMGEQNGREQAEGIKRVLRRYADLAGTKWDTHADVVRAVANPELYFGPDDLDELHGMAHGAGVTMANLVAHNLRLYLDAGAGGLHFAVTAGQNRDDGLLHAANEDVQQALCLRDCLDRNLQVRRPNDGIAYVTFAAAGQVGGLNGVNAAGLAISTVALLDVPKSAAASGRKLPTVLVKEILTKATNVESALELIRRSRASAAVGLCLSHHTTDRLCYVEFDGQDVKVQSATPSVLASNHRLMKTVAGDAPQHSQSRLKRLKDLLGGEEPRDVSVSRLQQTLRDRFDAHRGRELTNANINTIRRVDNQISIVIQPAKGNLWVTLGPQSNGHQSQFKHLSLKKLLPGFGDTGHSQEAESAAPAPLADTTVTGDSTTSSGEAEISADALNNSYAAAEQRGAELGNDSPVCSRFTMRMVEKPLPAEVTNSRALNGPVMILGSNAAANALRTELEQQGAAVVQLPASDDIDATLSRIDQHFDSSPTPHLVIATACDEDAVTSLESVTWNARRLRGVTIPYRVAQRWFQKIAQAEMLSSASVTALTSMGGDYGFSGQPRNVESGALAGLLKGIGLEVEMARGTTSFAIKILDVSATMAPNEVAKLALREMRSEDSEHEVGYRDGRRFVPRPVAEAADTLTLTDLPQGAPFVVTGGARGVTAVVALELGRRFGLKLHLIGSSPIQKVADAYHSMNEDELKEVRATVMKEALANGEKPIDGWARFEKTLEIDKTIRQFAAQGVEATYHACDVSDRRALAGVLNDIRAAAGPIQGIIHGAGFERAASFEKKQPELVERTVAAKVDGAAALFDLTRDDPLKYFAAFASISGRFGGVGQTDYCMANEMLAKLISWCRVERPDCSGAVFHWHAWDDVGMAVRPESKHIRKLHNINFMPSLEGADHLINELRAGLPEREIVVTELAYCRDRYADSLGDQPEASHGTEQPAADVATSPLVDAVVAHVPKQSLLTETNLDPTSDVFLNQHRFKGHPLMPVVMTLETIAEAAALAAGSAKQVAELSDIKILNGLRFHTDAAQTGRVQVDLQDDVANCNFTCDVYNRKGKLLLKDKPYLECQVKTAEPNRELKLDPCGMPASWQDVAYPDEDIVIWHGPEFRCLYQIAVEGDEGWGRLKAPAIGNLGGSRQGDNWVTPAALLDSSFFACGVFLWVRFPGVVAIPAGIDRIQLGRPPRTGEECIVHMRYRGREGNQGIFDFDIRGDDGTAIVSLEGYRNVIVSEAPANASS